MSVHLVACGTFSVPGNFFQDHLRGHPEVISAEALWLTRSYDETDPFLRLKTWLPAYYLISCQKEEIPVIFRKKNRHALLTCGSDVTQ